MDFKYYKDIPTSSRIWFSLIDASGKVLADYPNASCFQPIAHGFNTATNMIKIYHEKQLVPYSVMEIQRWINDLNEIGFPCSFKEELDPIVANHVNYINETVNNGLEDMTFLIMRQGKELPALSHHYFFVNIHDYENKNHMFSTLFLIRCLLELGCNKIPEEYFKLMDLEPSREKFEACQIAHKIVTCKKKRYDPACFANTGHLVTFDGNGENITKSALMERFAKNKINLHDKGYLRVNCNWNSSNDAGWRQDGSEYYGH